VKKKKALWVQEIVMPKPTTRKPIPECNSVATTDEPGLFAALEDQGQKRNAYFSALNKRNQGLIDCDLAHRSLLIIGAGSVGSGMAETLTRVGIGRLIVVDPDAVEAHNLTRSAYRACDIGKPKVDALADILKAINPWLRVEAHGSRLEEMPKSVLKTAIESCDLVICAADDKLTQAKVNRIAMHHKKPLVMVGVYAGARGGEAVMVLPGVTPCLECTLAGRRFDESRSAGLERATDYGTGRLEPTVGLGCDIHFVTNAASKLTISLLSAMSGAEETKEAGGLVLGALCRAENLVIFGMTPDFWFLPDVMGTAAGQHAFQSVWLKADAGEGCTVCGSARTAIDPIDEMQSAPNVQAMRDQHVTA